MREIYERLHKEMKRGVKDKELRPEQGELAAFFFLGILRALIIRDLVLEKSGDLGTDLERLLDAFFDGVSPQRRSS